MPRQKKYSQRYARGCRLCGDQNIGRGIEKHVRGAHAIEYEDYLKCFEKPGKAIMDELIDTGSTTDGGTNKVILHVLVKRFKVPVS